MMATASLPKTCTFKSFTTRKITPAFIKTPASLRSMRSVSRYFGLRSSPDDRAFAMAVHKVKLIGLRREEFEFEAPDEAYILDSAENVGVDLAYSRNTQNSAHLRTEEEYYRAACIRFCRPIRRIFPG